MRYFLGIDVGSSKTHTLIVDENGQCVGFGKAGGGNHQGVGYEGTHRVMQTSFDEALKTSGVDKTQIAGAGFGVAGYDFPSDREAHLQEIAKLGLSCPVEIVNDGVNGLLAGATRGIGVNVTAGSSNNARGRNKHGKEGRIVGNGSAFGEQGGGIEIVQRGLQMVNHAWIKRIPPTVLTQIFLEATGAKNEIDLMEGLSNEQYHLFPFIAVQIIQAAREQRRRRWRWHPHLRGSDGPPSRRCGSGPAGRGLAWPPRGQQPAVERGGQHRGDPRRGLHGPGRDQS